MEINQSSFRKELLSVLRHISEATFISFDLEMSGISTKTQFSSGDRGRPKLQQYYDEMKSAAETFQVLQVGITCVEENREKEFYLARPFNFNLSPLTADYVELRMERTFSFSSSACDFLTKNHFDFGKVFKEGVPYLSREEEEVLREQEKSRLDKQSKIPDVVIPANEPTTLEFYRAARQKLSAWVKDKKKADYCNIESTAGPLNGYQRRLIHQLVRNEFPLYRAQSKMDGKFMQVLLLDQKREAEFQNRLLRQFKQKINKQKGLRWVFEALSGGDLSEIDAEWFCNKDSETYEEELKAIKLELKSITSTLNTKTHVIVGHNLFTDLGFLYKTFVGPLASKVGHFQEDIHELFPIVIDTKYLATHGQDSMNPRGGLKDLLEPFKKLHFPFILLHENHTSYGSSFGKEHEAGYDSWMTAELFVKLSAQLFRESQLSRGEIEPPSEPIQSDEPDDENCMTFSSDESDDGPTGGGVPLFSSTNPFDALREAEESLAKNDDMAKYIQSSRKPGSIVPKMLETEPDVVESGQFIPDMGNAFWDIYLNKLRVHGTELGVCDLAEVALVEEKIEGLVHGEDGEGSEDVDEDSDEDDK